MCVKTRRKTIQKSATAREPHKEKSALFRRFPLPAYPAPGRNSSRLGAPVRRLINLPGWEVPAIKKAGPPWRGFPIALPGEADLRGSPELGLANS
ncbi:hypothetical protein AAVH_22559 [Aphelenchoides avenae]|nr:hypothetical protein AAVH_22559 [Aphelenchus avenae]